MRNGKYTIFNYIYFCDCKSKKKYIQLDISLKNWQDDFSVEHKKSPPKAITQISKLNIKI